MSHLETPTKGARDLLKQQNQEALEMEPLIARLEGKKYGTLSDKSEVTPIKEQR
jgi:hypothetical protein